MQCQMHQFSVAEAFGGTAGGIGIVIALAAVIGKCLMDSGAAVVFGSDAPIEIIDPLPGIHAAVTRQRASGYPGPGGWHPEQRLTIEEAVRGFTTAAAYTSEQEARLGSIMAGKLADMTIFERNIFTMPPDELLEAGIAGTVIAGEFLYRAW